MNPKDLASPKSKRGASEKSRAPLSLMKKMGVSNIKTHTASAKGAASAEDAGGTAGAKGTEDTTGTKGTAGAGGNVHKKYSPKARKREITKTGIIGIITNIFLSIAKILIGLAASSLAIVLDGVNNIADVGSSVVTIVGVQLASKPADKKHPMGYGRIEYLSALIVGIIIFLTGLFALRDAIQKIIDPTFGDYGALSFWVIFLAVFVKIFLGSYTRKKGKETHSAALLGSGKDSLFDALVSATTLLAMGTDVLFGFTIDGWVSTFISFVVIKAGWDLMHDVVGEILGARINPKLAQEIKMEIAHYPEVLGVHDLFLDNYGPNQMIGSVHIAVNYKMTAQEIDVLSRKISMAIYSKFHIILTCGVYGVVSDDPEEQALFKSVTKVVMNNKEALSIHAFFWDRKTNIVRFDIVRSFDVKHPEQWLSAIVKRLEKEIPGYTFKPLLDIDYSD